ncbi:TorF family putative porin [Pseudomonas sp. B21-056]|jgi:uncharacterized protein (TIGR02001 family)|uniref:TorF family putative porin n=1 Tax=Pseudomonas sp. B21-056 TaxID=2895495 RepID=UPI00222F59FD|nr:TorF family putative porin [Pseudomonas sp. B21-056]UZE25976.1 TorF family putative porin [Pseudomonas sp. B21-056]
MICKKVPLAATLLALFDPTHVLAMPIGGGFDLGIDVTATSDYRYFGISQTQGDPALQVGATLTSPIGAYIGTWVTNVDFGRTAKSKTEQDYYAGWYIPITDSFSIDVGWLKYTYDKNSESNQASYYAIATYEGLKLTYQYTNELLQKGSSNYTALAYEYPLTDDSRINVRYGILDYKDNLILSGSGKARSKYAEWEARVEKDYWEATWSASLVDTDLSATECTSLSGYDDLCSAELVLSVTKKF